MEGVFCFYMTISGGCIYFVHELTHRQNDNERTIIIMKQYKAVEGPQNINVAAGKAQEAFNLYANIINREATGGWEYHSMESIAITEKPGCFQQPVTVNYYMLIFVREV